PPRPQDQQLALAGRQLAGQELAAERQPPAEQSGMAHERGEDVLGRAGAGHAAEQLSLVVVEPVEARGRWSRGHGETVATGLTAPDGASERVSEPGTRPRLRGRAGPCRDRRP